MALKSVVVLGLDALAFASWAVYLGGLAALQSSYPGKNNFRFEWWVMSYEFFIIALLAVVAVTGQLRKFRSAFTALFAIGAIYYSYYAQQYVPFVIDSSPAFDALSSSLQTRYQVLAAGLIATSVSNFFVILAVGFGGSEAEAAAAPPKDASAV